MKIVIINGSPHKAGTSAVLLEQFKRGAKEKGHQVDVFDAAKEKVTPCIACDHCRTTDKGCVFKDGMEKLNPLLLDAELVVFATPLYYFGLSAQLKSVIDRFYANNSALKTAHKKTAILATCGDNESWTTDALKLHYETICSYLNWDIIDSIYAKGVYEREDIEGTEYPKLAYEMGLKL